MRARANASSVRAAGALDWERRRGCRIKTGKSSTGCQRWSPCGSTACTDMGGSAGARGLRGGAGGAAIACLVETDVLHEHTLALGALRIYVGSIRGQQAGGGGNRQY